MVMDVNVNIHRSEVTKRLFVAAATVLATVLAAVLIDNSSYAQRAELDTADAPPDHDVRHRTRSSRNALTTSCGASSAMKWP